MFVKTIFILTLDIMYIMAYTLDTTLDNKTPNDWNELHTFD